MRVVDDDSHKFSQTFTTVLFTSCSIPCDTLSKATFKRFLPKFSLKKIQFSELNLLDIIDFTNRGFT